MSKKKVYKSGFVTLIGRPNVGKSTLMNHLIGQKIAITSEKPQTTRNRIQTVYTDERGQIIFLDTPGIHKAKNKLGEYMVSVAEHTLKEVDVILWLVEPGTYIGASEQQVLKTLNKVKTPVILVINKIDGSGNALPGAGFTLYKKNLAGAYNPIGGEIKGENLTTFTWKGLDDGDYKLVETTVPEGFNKMSDILFSISAVHSETAGEPTLVSLDGGLMGTGVVDTGAITKEIENHTGTVLPETGAMGTMWLILGGATFVILAGVFMITRKKMSIYED